jgi:NAD(P)-dependent dehydrogenase (short-subunit alcohol dehydrogenase family)
MDELRGRTAVITGSGSGIGRGMAVVFADEGINVVVADIDAEAAEQTAEDVRAKGVGSIAVRTDVSEPASVQALAEVAYEEFGPVHLLCNNAGVAVSKPVMDLGIEDWNWLLAVNLLGVVNGVFAFVPRMRAQGGEAHIVNTASIAGLAPNDSPNQGVYSPTKAAIAAYSEVLREELAPDRIGVSVLLPGRVANTNLKYSEERRQQKFGGPIAVPRSDPEDRGDAPDEWTVRRILHKVDADELDRIVTAWKSDDSRKPPDVLLAGGGRWRMTAEEVGRKVVMGIKANRAYIAADPGRKLAAEQRFGAILEDFDRSAQEDENLAE